MKGCGLEPAEATVRSDLLLERRDLAHAGSYWLRKSRSGAWTIAIFVLQAHDRVRTEEGRRVLALDAVLVEIPDAIPPEDHGPARRERTIIRPTPGWAAIVATSFG